MDILHKPVKNIYIAMHTNVNVIERFVAIDKLVKVLHVLNDQVTLTSEVLSSLLCFITNMDDDKVLRNDLFDVSWVRTNWDCLLLVSGRALFLVGY